MVTEVVFGVPDEIQDVMRSLGMVRKRRLIYRKLVFGFRKVFEHCGSVPGVTNRFRGPTGWAHHAPRGPHGFIGCAIRYNGLTKSSKESP